jgi:N-acetylneuraminate epimerase
MKNITLYIILLITTALTPELLAQQMKVSDISWNITTQIPSKNKQTPSLGLAGAAVGNTAHKLIIAGGTNFPDKMPWDGGKKSYYNDVFIYDKSLQSLTLITEEEQSKLPFNLAYAAVCSTSKGIVIAGGENENGLSKEVLLLNFEKGELTVSYLPVLPKSLTNASLINIGNKVYLAGGETENGAMDQFLSLDLNKLSEGWKVLPNLPNEVSHAVLISTDQDIYLIGGRKRNVGDTSTLYHSVHVFNIRQQRWIAKNSLPYPISAATGIIKRNNILIFSGDKGETFHQVEHLIAAMDREKDSVKKEVLNQQKITLQANHPGFNRNVLKYDLITGIWTELKTLMPYGTVTTNAVVINDEVIIAGGEIKAGVRTPNIMIGKLKTSK